MVRHSSECQRYSGIFISTVGGSEEGKRTYKILLYSYMVAFGNTWICSCLLPCVFALWCTRTYCCTWYVLRCSVQGLLQAVLLCLRCVDNVVNGTWVVHSWCAQDNSDTGSQTNNGRRGKKGIQQNSLEIDRKKGFSRRQIEAETLEYIATVSSEVDEIKIMFISGTS